MATAIATWYLQAQGTNSHLFNKVRSMFQPEVPDEMLDAMLETTIPGRLQYVDLEPLTGRTGTVLLDGAHNHESWQPLRQYVKEQLTGYDHRTGISNNSVVWVLALSDKSYLSPERLIKYLARGDDEVFITDFKPVEGMPWVKPKPFEKFKEHKLKRHINPSHLHICSGKSLQWVLDRASKAAEEQKRDIIITGSLYLVSDVLRLLRQTPGSTDVQYSP